MQELVTEREFEEPIFEPYGFYPETGDCADTFGMTDVSKLQYDSHIAFRLAGRLLVKHAP